MADNQTIEHFARAERRPRKMSDIQHVPAGFISPYREYSRHNTQTLSGVSHLWQDFFAQALADQLGDRVPAAGDYTPVPIDGPNEPAGGSELLSEIVSQRACDIVDTEIRPPEPLFLPIAEFEMDLLDPPAPPYPPEELVEQQKQLDFDIRWARPIILHNLRIAA